MARHITDSRTGGIPGIKQRVLPFFGGGQPGRSWQGPWLEKKIDLVFLLFPRVNKGPFLQGLIPKRGTLLALKNSEFSR